MSTTRHYGHIRDTHDERDYLFIPKPETVAALPPAADLAYYCPPVYDQGQLGSCTANGLAAAVEFDQRKQGQASYTPSRLQIYYDERAMEDTVSQDAGAMIRDGAKSLNKQGACPETEWPYDITRFATKPPESAYAAALKDRALVYHRVQQTLTGMKSCLAEGYPVVIGITVYNSFESDTVAASGMVPMPKHGEEVVGGHCVLLLGYDDATQMFHCRNSWGAGWGKDGNFFIPYVYLTNRRLASDFWVIRSVSAAEAQADQSVSVTTDSYTNTTVMVGADGQVVG